MDYPLINRENVSFLSDTEVCNIGYNEGEMSDGRPYRIEEWSSYGVLSATVFISILGLEKMSEKEIKHYLVNEHLIEIIKDKIYITEVEDINDNIFISINIPLEDKEEILNKCLIKLKDYEY